MTETEPRNGRIQAVTMPKWGIEMTEGTVSRWSVEEGQAVEKGAPLLDVETEKIVNTVDAPAGGTLRRILAAAGDLKPVGALLAVLASPEVAEAELEQFIAEFRGAVVSFEPQSAGAAVPQARPQADSQPDLQATAGDDTQRALGPPAADAQEEARVSPLARRLAESLGIDITGIRGTGRNGRITREDVAAYAARLTTGQGSGTGGPSASPPVPGCAAAGAPVNAPVRKRLSPTRATIARRLLESKQAIPHYRLSLDVTCGALLERAAAASRDSGRRITLNDLLLRGCALALIAHPGINAWLEDGEILEFPHADIAIAVSAPSGLITPVVRAADTKSLAEIAAATADLTARARSGSLTREDITGGTFTLSNLGMFGLARFDAIVNPPQVAILAAGAAQDRVIARDGAPIVAKVMTLTLSADHRVVDGAAGAAFLASLRELIEAPGRL
ncbi:MAG TPA: dihydrolipoamide acetyltransferase family protein [Steroidobacteraceae bacterium]|jgi:pyruvate dehydrogenase E2 component (dihydrolipoamide acetyltransferase)|nr:dihydrolipoamide acetyltransferase family protein [Steroidobacteraceae bacterium]